MFGGAVGMFLFYFYRVVAGGVFIGGVGVGVQFQYQFIRRNNPDKQQQHYINSNFSE